MKRILWAVLVCLLLCGCTGDPAETTEATHQPAVPATEPAGCYEPGSAVEQTTDGAVRAYRLDWQPVYSIRMMGDDLLVFSGEETTTLIRLTGENLFRIAEAELDFWLCSQAEGLYISDDRLIYYDASTAEQVYLDENLREIRRVAMPADLQGEPLLTGDRSHLYYCTAAGVHVMDMDTGISRLLKEMTFPEQKMEALLLGDTVLRVSVRDDRGNGETLFLDWETGAMVGGLSENMTLTSGADHFYGTVREGIVTQMIFGTAEATYQLHPADYRDSGVFLTESHGAVVYHQNGEELSLEYYDLHTGQRQSVLESERSDVIEIADAGNGTLYLLAGQENQKLYRWNTAAFTAADQRGYIGPHYTAYSPDREGLAQCRAYAEAVSSRYGVDIALITEAVDWHPDNYDLIPEYQVPVIMDALARLEKLLAQYPQGFLGKSVEGLEDGQLTLCLAREIRGSYASGNLQSVAGLHFWLDHHSFVVLAMGDELESNFHRQVYHALETRLLSGSIALYRWEELNPKGFAYGPEADQCPDIGEHLEDTTRAFADTRSMLSPREDRAAVMAYACMPGNENYFISYTMQKKLLALCQGIREAYGMEGYPRPLLWEQYLESPIHP